MLECLRTDWGGPLDGHWDNLAAEPFAGPDQGSANQPPQACPPRRGVTRWTSMVQEDPFVPGLGQQILAAEVVGKGFGL